MGRLRDIGKRSILVFSLVLLSPLYLYAQPAATMVEAPLRFDHLTIEDGLSQNDVFAILQDRRGFMWFGTNFGLNRYDGYTFSTVTLLEGWILALHEDREGKLWVGTLGGLFRVAPSTGAVTRYLHDPDDPGSLSNNAVWTIYEDRAGTLWVGTTEGLNRREGRTDRFTHFRYDPADVHSLSSDVVYALHEDPTGTLWVSTANGLNRLDPDKPGHFTRYLHDSGPVGTIRHDIIYGIAAEPDRRKNVIRHLCNDPVVPGILWVSTESGLLRFDTETGRHVRYLPDPDDPEANTVMDVEPDPAATGVLWLTTNGGGLYRFDTQTEQFTAYRHDPRSEASISSNKLFPLYADRTGLLWVGSFEGGVNKAYPASGGFTHYRRVPAAPGTLSHNGVWAIQEDPSGAVWIGTNDGLNRFEPDAPDTRFTQYLHDSNDPHSLSGSNVNALLVDRAGMLWVALYPGGLNRYDREQDRFIHYRHDPNDSTTLSNDYPSSIFEDRAGTLWVGTWSGGLNKLDRATGRFTHYRHDPNDSTTLSDDHIMPALLEDAGGTLWVGTNNGLNRFDATTQTFTRYVHDPNNPKSLDHSAILCIYERTGEPGVLWLATSGGLDRFDTRTGQFTYFTEEDGLPTNQVRGILEDAAGRLWLSTARGLSRFDPETGAIHNYDLGQGLQSREFNPGAFFKRADGSMLFGGINGFNLFYPNRIVDHPVPPAVVISGFRLFNEPVPVGEDSPLHQPLIETEAIRLAARQKVFTFEFVALHYLHPKKNQYAYQLEGFDEDWVRAGTRREATYTNLDPGTYTFRVKASNSDGVWNEEGTSMKVVIAPPWWRTAWAYGLYALSLILGIFVVDRVQRRRLIRQEQEKARIREARIKAQAAEERARSLQEIDEMKSRFFANISHEFRTPLTLITGPLEDLLADTDSPPDLQEQHRSLLRHARRLLRLVNQLLDLTKLEAGRMELHPQPGDLAAFLRDLVQTFVPLAERRQLTLRFESEQAALPLPFDPDTLEKVFGNLLSNALKFTPEGGKVWVTLGTREVGDATVVEAVVKDTGPGIPREALPRIFDRFEQVASATTQVQGGTGIGLALAKELIERHGGQILVESEPGFGSAFIVRIPFISFSSEKEIMEAPLDTLPEDTDLGTLRITEEAATLDPPMTTSPKDALASDPFRILGVPKILIVEDNAEVRAFLRKHLEAAYQIREAADGAAGLAAARETPPDLILSDVMMPVMDGYALCRAVKADERLRTIPVILLTAKAGEQETVHGLESGADDYIAKPFSVSELKARVAALLRARRQARQQFSREIVVQPAGITIQPEDEVFLDRVLAVVEAHLGDSGFGAEAMADAVGLSRRQFERRLVEAAGETPAELLRRMRLERACQLLEARSGPIAEVAYAVGFRSPAHFSKAFRKAFGVTPSAFSDNAS